LALHLEEGAVGRRERGFGTFSVAAVRRRRTRAVVAGAVTFAVVVGGGLIALANRAPADDVAASPSHGDASPPGPSASATAGHSRLGPPTHLKIHRGVTSVTLAWDAPAATAGLAVQHYEVFGDGKRLARPTRAKYRVTGLTFGTRYRFWVVAVDEEGRTSPRVLRSTTTKLPAVSAARLSGTYAVTARLTSSVGERVKFSSHSITWSLRPGCPDVACNVSFTATHRFGSDTVVTSGVLDWSGTDDYTGKWIGSFGTTCRSEKQEAISTLVITMHATSARVVGGLWVASRIAGTIHEHVSGCGGSPAAVYQF
jgi:chitodextrinase